MGLSCWCSTHKEPTAGCVRCRAYWRAKGRAYRRANPERVRELKRGAPRPYSKDSPEVVARAAKRQREREMQARLNALPVRRPWTAEEDAFLLESSATNYGAALALHRTIKATAGRRRALRNPPVQEHRWWTPEEDAIILASTPQESAAQIGLHLNRTSEQVKWRKRVLRAVGLTIPRGRAGSHPGNQYARKAS